MNDSDDGPGWLAESGVACLFGRHWPAAALSAGAGHQRTSRCADCGTPMVRQVDGRWRVSHQPVLADNYTVRAR